MFAGLKHLVGNVSVEVKHGIVTVEGIRTSTIGHDIKRLWGTGRIEANLFLTIDSYAFSFYEFFALEVHYAISRLIDDRKTKSSRRTLARIVEALEEHTWLANRNKTFPSKLDYDKLHQMAFPPLPFHEKFYEDYDQGTQQLGLRGKPLAGAAGSGKTYCGITLAELLHADLTIILSPKPALESVWATNLLEDFKKPPTFWLCTDDKPYAGQKYIVINYEWLAKLLELVKTILAKAGKRLKIVIVVDESHSFNEADAQRTQYLIELRELTDCQDMLWMSGTPIKALSVETIPLFRCIDPLFTPDVEAAFRKIFGVSTERGTDILNNRLNGILYKIEKKELGLIPPIFQEIKVTIPNGHKYTLREVTKAMRAFTEERLAYYKSRSKQDEKTYYDAMDVFAATKEGKKSDLRYYFRCVEAVIKAGGDARFCKDEMVFCNRFENRTIIPALPKELREGFREAKTLVKYVKLKVQGECLGRVVGRMRIQAHLDMAEHVDYVAVIENSTKKTVVFTSYTEVVDKLEAHLKTLDLEPLVVYAKTNHMLTEILDQFEKDRDANPLVATYKSLSTAVPLIMADQLVLIDAPWRDYQLQQTVARISRLGADTQTYVFTCILDTGNEPNISSRSLDILKWSQQAVAQITGIVSPYEITDNLEEADLALEHYGEEQQEAPASPSFMSWE